MINWRLKNLLFGAAVGAGLVTTSLVSQESGRRDMIDDVRTVLEYNLNMREMAREELEKAAKEAVPQDKGMYSWSREQIRYFNSSDVDDIRRDAVVARSSIYKDRK